MQGTEVRAGHRVLGTMSTEKRVDIMDVDQKAAAQRIKRQSLHRQWLPAHVHEIEL